MTAPHEPDRGPEKDDDAVFRQIVAGFGDAQTDPVPPWPVSEDLSDEVSADAPAPPEPLPLPEVEVELEGLPGWLEPAALADEGHFAPPPPPRLPRLRPRTLAGVVLMLAGFAGLFVPYRVGLDESPGSLMLGSLLVLGGLAVLVGSMRDAPGSDDRPDGGAVV